MTRTLITMARTRIAVSCTLIAEYLYPYRDDSYPYREFAYPYRDDSYPYRDFSHLIVTLHSTDIAHRTWRKEADAYSRSTMRGNRVLKGYPEG